MTFEEFWKENYEKEFGTSEPYYGIASYAFEKGQENCNCVYTDNSNVIERLEKENAELEAQIEKMKCCENCAWWYKLPNGQRDCAETCENRDNWSLRRCK